MKLAIIMAAIMALACPVASIEPFDVRKPLPEPLIKHLYDQCDGRPDCLKCIDDLYSSGNFHLASQCQTCNRSANPGLCYKCITNMPSGPDAAPRAILCQFCGNQKGQLAEGCSECLALTPTPVAASECQRCRSIECFSCLRTSTSIRPAFDLAETGRSGLEATFGRGRRGLAIQCTDMP